MPRVHKLPETLANRIAAGEVVDRPASVVKELVENSLDASAGRIEVELRDGGKKLIVVSDDGLGMDREDALLAVERFATSKISSDDDLHRIETMGFRGEALPSIGAVSRMRILTRPPEATEGTLVVVEGGEVKAVEAVGCPPGTRVEVADLFFNTPARRKFLSSTNTERGHCHEWVVRLALARPDVAFKLTHDDAVLMATVGRGELLHVMAAVWGSNAARQFLPVHFQAEGVTLEGYVSGPRLMRATRQHQFFFVNRRFVRSRSLSHALTQAYGSLLPASRQPLCVLHLHLPPEDVDPNVHPTKIEVRFPSEGRIHDLTVRAVRQALEAAGLRPHLPPPLPGGQRSAEGAGSDYVRASHLRTSPIADKLDVRDDGLEVHGRPLSLEGPEPKRRREEVRREVAGGSDAADEALESRGKARVLGQLGLRYILVATEGALLVVDQHRAAERVLFDELARSRTLAKQFLAMPVPLELSPRQAAAAAEHRQLLAGMGFDVESFGRSGWLLRAVPAGMEYQAPQEAARDLLEELAEWKVPASADEREEQMRAMVACHAAIKAGQRLTQEEMQRLVEALLATSSPAVCPHGDPIILTLKLEDIDRRMERPAKKRD